MNINDIKITTRNHIPTHIYTQAHKHAHTFMVIDVMVASYLSVTADAIANAKCETLVRKLGMPKIHNFVCGLDADDVSVTAWINP